MMKNQTAVPSSLDFRRVGGSLQPAVKGFCDFPALIELDEAHWAVTSIDIDSLRVSDRRFLELMDTDSNRKLRTDEVKAALAFMVRNLRDGSGVDQGLDSVHLEALNPDSPEAPAMIAAAKLILANLGKRDTDSISIDELRRDKEIRACTSRNGDGVIVPDQDVEPELAETISAVMAVIGSKMDISGLPGISAEELEAFVSGAAARIAVLEEPVSRAAEVMPFGADTAALCAEVEALDGLLKEYFLAAETAAFVGSGDSGWYEVPPSLAPDAVRALLEKRPAAALRADGALDFNGALNPLWRERLLKFAADPHFSKILVDGVLTRAAWERFAASFAGFIDYRKRFEESSKFAAYSRDDLVRLSDPERVGKLRTLIAEDLEAAGVLSGGAALHKLLMFQKYMLEFLNNFVSLSALFDPERISLIQAGKLVMDGRHFTLVTPVLNQAEHKRIATLSDICTMYIEVSFGRPDAPPPRTLAVAVTSGNMRNLFVGKRGIFFPAGSSAGVADAKVIDFIEQPVSISEALISPFFKFAAFVGKQADRFFSAKSADAQKELGGAIDGKLAAPSKPAQTPAVSGSMMLMGGGIGIAAIGSSVAFIVKSLQHVSVLNVLVVLLGIIMIFGGPMVVVALIKLFRRNLARFLEASGCAVNRRMRLSRRMGLIFTFTPVISYARLLRKDLVKAFNGEEDEKPSCRWALWLVLLFLAAALAALWHFFPDWRLI